VHAEDAARDAEPAEQFWHTVRDVAATTSEAVPALQFEHPPENPTRASLYVPAAQSAHAVAAAAENCPAVQFWHCAAPAAAAKRPGGQGVHARCAAPDALPGEHGSHGAAPRVALALPGVHAVHATVPVPVYPKSQLQFVPAPATGLSSTAKSAHCPAAAARHAARAAASSAARQPGVSVGIAARPSAAHHRPHRPLCAVACAPAPTLISLESQLQPRTRFVDSRHIQRRGLYSCAERKSAQTTGRRMREKTHAESAEAPDAVRLRRLVWLGSLVMCLHTGTSYLEEVLFKRLAFTSAFFMVLVMCVIYVGGYLVARAWASRGGRNGARRPLFEMGDSRSERLTMGALCLAYVGSNALSKLSLNYVTVPMMYVCVCVCAWVRQSVRACAAAGWRARWRAFQTREEAGWGQGERATARLGCASGLV
jgi:hypothetical protein